MHASRSLAGARLRGAARTSGSASTRRLHAAAAPVLRRSGPHARGARAPAPRAAARRGLSVNALLDYVATASDDGVLRLPARTELDPEEIKNVYNYPRNLPDNYHIGKVIGAGSFGTVREAVSIATGHTYAVKTVSKVPKRGPPTPRCEEPQAIGG
ncbi:hypothetical protein MNEG_0876 [Monoraphidium neglectum]|uniref:Protein kinase domain-containing protein n=1 Tax=Monoraphidium neglectum TaxID=145388 RepID=A0A0D2N459_9CHLO|nr:hypothetical protein MNEG_0876 [Monoraphidium neglectum]KIZ07087.1 hypothetical protein MNEG_0876 [Monoraphidium neglectum]|eukprot:XP_013906106.1 hypothetical protein MNEG_0876 [Monoraphidium neglectum]